MFSTSFISIFLALLIGAAVVAVLVLLLFLGMKLIVSVGSRIFGFVTGEIGDVLIMIGAIIGLFIAAPLAIFFLVLGRWESANRQARAFGDRIARIGHAIGSILLVRPLRLVYLDGPAHAVKGALPGYMPDGAELFQTRAAKVDPVGDTGANQRVFGVESVPSPKIGSAQQSTSDPGQFDGYELVGGLRAGGSGARLFIAKPTKSRRERLQGNPEQVVIKSFALEQGSSLPSIVRESRALEGARRMGLVLEHHLDEERFWYVMPYHAGSSLGVIVESMHSRGAARGLRGDDLAESLSYVRDLLQTLTRFHEAGLWHKDVKPDNLIVHDGSAHLVDLGLVTSLQSSLTLTTHGTEYFRDPELVRMALRGVKVHEVDGAKFDVYGAGAVLYYVFENDFPAHGGLSDFTRPVPDAVQWIVRRAMADYAKRYQSAAAMLADLDTVAAAQDPWKVRPADLPSMKEGSEGIEVIPPPPPFARTSSARVSRSARMPLPPRVVPTPKATPIRPRKAVPTDRPSGTLLLLGLLTTAAIIGAVYTALQITGPTTISAPEYATRALGTGATTMTLSSPDGQYRVLLIRDESAHLESNELREATDRVIEWYEASGYSADTTPDLTTLAEAAIQSAPIDLTAETNPEVGAVLDAYGYTSLVRVMADSNGDGTPELRQLHSNGNLSIIPVKVDEEIFPSDARRTTDVTQDSFQISECMKRVAHTDSPSSLVSWGVDTLSERTQWAMLNTLELDSKHSWQKVSSRHLAPSTHSLHVRSRTPVLMPPTSPAAHGRTSRATPTSA